MSAANEMTRIVSRPIVFDHADVDTDQIFPGRFLSTLSRSGLGRIAFHDLRFDTGGKVLADSVFDRPGEPRSILVSGANFGCGSSREHAVWAIADLGVRAVLAPSFGDIFKANALKNGLTVIELPAEALTPAAADPEAEIRVDLQAQFVEIAGRRHAFVLDAFDRACLLSGSDQLGHLIESSDAISQFEGRFDARFPPPGGD